MRKGLLILVLLLGVNSVFAQVQGNFWMRGTIGLPILENLVVDNEFQHRRQNGVANFNPFENDLMFTYRMWLHYDHDENVRFSISPFSYYSNNKIILEEEDIHLPSIKQFRFASSVLLQKEVINRFHLVARFAGEYHLSRKDVPNRMRVRARFGAKYNMGGNMSVQLFDEVLFNVQGVPYSRFFDHNRLGVNFEYQFNNGLLLDIGYVFINRLLLYQDLELKEHNIFVNFSYRFKSFTRK